jgi:hypothetical protein
METIIADHATATRSQNHQHRIRVRTALVVTCPLNKTRALHAYRVYLDIFTAFAEKKKTKLEPNLPLRIAVHAHQIILQAKVALQSAPNARSGTTPAVRLEDLLAICVREESMVMPVLVVVDPVLRVFIVVI